MVGPEFVDALAPTIEEAHTVGASSQEKALEYLQTKLRYQHRLDQGFRNLVGEPKASGANGSASSAAAAAAAATGAASGAAGAAGGAAGAASSSSASASASSTHRGVGGGVGIGASGKDASEFPWPFNGANAGVTTILAGYVLGHVPVPGYDFRRKSAHVAYMARATLLAAQDPLR